MLLESCILQLPHNLAFVIENYNIDVKATQTILLCGWTFETLYPPAGMPYVWSPPTIYDILARKDHTELAYKVHHVPLLKPRILSVLTLL